MIRNKSQAAFVVKRQNSMGSSPSVDKKGAINGASPFAKRQNSEPLRENEHQSLGYKKTDDGDGKILADESKIEHQLLLDAQARLEDKGLPRISRRIAEAMRDRSDDEGRAILATMSKEAEERMFQDLVSEAIVTHRLNHMAALAPAHCCKGIGKVHFDTLKRSVVFVCKDELKEQWSAELEAAYVAAFDTAANYLINAIDEADPAFHSQLMEESMESQHKSKPCSENGSTTSSPDHLRARDRRSSKVHFNATVATVEAPKRKEGEDEDEEDAK